MKTSSGHLELNLDLGSAMTVTLTDSLDEVTKTHTTKAGTADMIDIHIMCEENQIHIYVDNLKLDSLDGTNIDASEHGQVVEVEIESFDKNIEDIGYDITGYDPATTFNSPDLSPFIKIGCRDNFELICARVVDGFYDFIQVYTNSDFTEVKYLLANSIKKCHRTPAHSVMCNIVDMTWDPTPIGGSSAIEGAVCAEGVYMKLGSQCINKDAIDNDPDPVSHEAAEAICYETTDYLAQPKDIYQSIVLGVYAEFNEFPTFWVGLKKVGNAWAKPDGNKLQIEEEFWGPGEPGSGDCVIADSNIEYRHRTVNCEELHQVLGLKLSFLNLE